jgi:hypothetical protein
MQTQEQFEQKLDSMLPKLLTAIREEAIRLFKSGAVDPEAHHDNYVLPKICLIMALDNTSIQYMPTSPGDKRDLANLKHF